MTEGYVLYDRDRDRWLWVLCGVVSVAGAVYGACGLSLLLVRGGGGKEGGWDGSR